jgi:hypothetical protein
MNSLLGRLHLKQSGLFSGAGPRRITTAISSAFQKRKDGCVQVGDTRSSIEGLAVTARHAAKG